MWLDINYDLLKSWKMILLTTLLVVLAYQAIIYLHPENLDWMGSDYFSIPNLLWFVWVDQYLIECCTVAITFFLIRYYARKVGLLEVRLMPRDLLYYELKFLPILAIAFLFFAPFSLSARFLLHYFPNLDHTIYFQEYFYSLKLYLNYLPSVLLTGYIIINVNLLRNYNDQLGQTKVDLLHSTQQVKTRLLASDEIGEVFLEVDQLLRIERSERKTFAHTSDGKYRLKENISQLESKLDPHKFVRINRATIIHLADLLNYSFWENDKYIVRLKSTDKEFLMSRDRLKKVKDLLKISLRKDETKQ